MALTPRPKPVFREYAGTTSAYQDMEHQASLLRRWQLFAPGQAFDGEQLGTLRLHGKHQAGTRRLSVEQDRAGAADPVLAADMSAGQPEILTHKIDEQLARFAAALIALPVDGQPDLTDFGHRIDLSSSSRNGLGDGAARQDAGQMTAIFRRTV